MKKKFEVFFGCRLKLKLMKMFYDNFFSPSGVCAPSRAAIATGMYPTHIAANCPLVLIPERYQKTKDKWIASKAKPKRVECSENVPPPKTKVDAQASSYSAASRRFFFKMQKYKMSYEALQQSESLESNHRVF